jgi:hypothetical protein
MPQWRYGTNRVDVELAAARLDGLEPDRVLEVVGACRETKQSVVAGQTRPPIHRRRTMKDEVVAGGFANLVEVAEDVEPQLRLLQVPAVEVANALAARGFVLGQ